MPKTKSSAIFSCDLCDFKVTNSYIFKRHLHRCLSIHGIASKRSSPRNPIRLKGTEGLLSKEGSHVDMCEVEENELSESAEDHAEGPDEEGVSSGKMSSQKELGTGPDSQSQVIAQDIPKIDDDAADETTIDGSLNKSSPVPSEDSLQGSPYNRTYNCQECFYECQSARDYLHHQRDIHGHSAKIYECKYCTYASIYNSKLERHMVVHVAAMSPTKEEQKTKQEDPQEIKEKNGSEISGFDASGRLKVKPLRLKRLNIKMPFKISDNPKLNTKLFKARKKDNAKAVATSLQLNLPTTPFKEVYRMVLLADGAHHYQCRDCLYYASIPSSVKKHHVLCHSRMLCCPHCNMSTRSQGIYYEHIATHPGYGYMKCADCSYVTNAKSNFEKHRSFHVEGFPVRCSVCNFGAESESKIKRHVATQHTPEIAPEEPSTESEAMTETIDTSLNNSYENESAELRGENNSMTYDGEVSTGQDDSYKHDEEQLAEYRCPKCPMICYRRGNFTRHLTAKHKFNQTSAASLSKNMESQMIRGLKRKVSSSNPLPKKKKKLTMENHKCSYCSYIAKWPSDLRRHMQVHTIVKRFKCSMCQNKYKYLGDLNVHMRRDHNMEPPENVTREITTLNVVKKASPIVFRCPICPFVSHSKAELEQHSRNHGNIDKTYQCRLCEYQTYWRGDVGRHLFRHHKIVLSKEAAEIGEYFINRPDIKPLTKQTSSSSLRNSSLSPSPSPEQGKSTISDSQQFWRDFPELWREGTPDSVKSSTSNGNSTSTSNGKKGSISLKDGAFICEFPNCDFKASTADRMESHIAVHLNLKTFVCPTCGKRSNWKWDIVKHLNKVHMNPSAGVEDVITLSIEEAKATIGDYLTKNDKKNKELTVSFCSLCDFKSLEKNRVIRHMATIHKNEKGKILGQPVTNPEDIHRDPILLQAGEQLSVDTDMNGEGSTESGKIAKFVEPSSDELAQFEKPYACAICKKPGSTKGDVKKHYNYTHPYKDVRVLYIGNGTEFNYYTGEIYSKSSNSDQGDFQDVKHLSPSAVSPSGKMLRPDSKFSNPKMHGYVKPFKCSICGLRSNWKWDLKKHLRSKHPGEGGFVIMLSIEEAAQTYGKDCSPSHPKNEDFLSIPKLSPSPSLTSIVNASPVPDNYLFKQPPNIKAEILEDSNDEDSQEGSFFPQSPSSSQFKLSKERATSFDPLRRQWKCSGCNYITNWRRNMARHIHRKHALEEEKIKVIPLNKDGRHGKSCSITKDWIAEESDMNGERSRFTAVDFVDDNRRLWKCPLCPFKSKLRTHIVGHMQQHSMKPFLCGVCNVPFMNRGPLHRHLQKIHKRSDYLKLTKTNIIFDGDSGAENGHYIDAFFCKVCNHESEDKEEIEKHLEECHGSKDTDHILKIQKNVGDVPFKSVFKSHFKQDGQKLSKKFHFCKICPYRSQKKSMLSFHMTYHKPNQANRFRCKYCPYFVSTQRLLHQHQRKWHKESSTKLGWDQQEQATPPSSPHKPHMGHTSGAGTPRRHYCQKCPYTTNSKNDFIYHKQFHRPKRTAEFKCEFCDYWVVHKRLLKQHMRLHTAAYPYSSGMSSDGSPNKSLYSDPGLVYDPVELTELAAIKQKMISAKITSSLPKSPSASPVKYDAQSSQDDKSGHADKNGLYRKVHRCRYCPYTNTRARNMQLHEMMHGPRDSIHALAKCPYCDYYVGSKGLLSHHMKVHQKNYGSIPENDPEFGENDEFMGESEHDVLPQPKVDTLLQISRFKRFGCERCPYASAKRQHFERHLELHGSRQRYTCQYCDYSVPSSNLLLQHTKLHMMPNQNLLASQSITNLQHLSEVPADVALASALPPADTDTTVTISVIHDHLGLYENSIYDAEPKKLYRCDRCPYANVRRDYLLSHLKFHMVPSVLVCPYCDYSAPKQPLLTQHIRVHFCPLPELSDWLLENGQTERETGQRHIDLAEALKVAHEYQNVSKKKGKAAVTNIEKDSASKDEKPEGKENVQDISNSKLPLTFICQYCDREFTASEKLVKHELQHLIGNHFERAEYINRNKKSYEQATSKVLTAQQIQQLPKEAEIKANSSCSIDETAGPLAGRDKKSRTKKTKESVEVSKSSFNAGTEKHSSTKRSSTISATYGNEEKPCSHIDATTQVSTSESTKDESNNATASKDSNESQVIVEPMQLDDNNQGIHKLVENSNDTGTESRLETKKVNDNKKENEKEEEHVSTEKLQKDDDNEKENNDNVKGSDFKESWMDEKNQKDVENECKTNEKVQNIAIRDVQEMETCVEKADEKELNENIEETGAASTADNGKERDDLEKVAEKNPTDSTEKEDKKNVTEQCSFTPALIPDRDASLTPALIPDRDASLSVQVSFTPALIPDKDASLSVQVIVDVLEETQLLACNNETEGKDTSERLTAEDEVLLLANDDSLRVEKSSL